MGSPNDWNRWLSCGKRENGMNILSRAVIALLLAGLVGCLVLFACTNQGGGDAAQGMDTSYATAQTSTPAPTPPPAPPPTSTPTPTAQRQLLYKYRGLHRLLRQLVCPSPTPTSTPTPTQTSTSTPTPKFQQPNFHADAHSDFYVNPNAQVYPHAHPDLLPGPHLPGRYTPTHHRSDSNPGRGGLHRGARGH